MSEPAKPDSDSNPYAVLIDEEIPWTKRGEAVVWLGVGIPPLAFAAYFPFNEFLVREIYRPFKPTPSWLPLDEVAFHHFAWRSILIATIIIVWFGMKRTNWSTQTQIIAGLAVGILAAVDCVFFCAMFTEGGY